VKIKEEGIRLYNEELYDLYSSLERYSDNQIKKKMRWARHLARTGDRTGAQKVSFGKRERKRSLERPRRRWDDNIKTDLQEVGWVMK